MNRIKQATQGEGGNGALPIYYKYNLSGQVTGVGYPKEDGDCVAAQGEGLQIMWYGYDGYGRISSVSYQKNGTLEAFESGIGYGKVTVREYLYTSGGELEKTVDYNRFDIDGSLVKNGARTVTEYVYDSAGRTVQTSYYNYAKGSAVGTLKEKHTITYDKNSGITGETIEDRYGSGLKTTEKRYVYDEAGRLTRAETDGEATEYTYDKVGNRLTQRKAGETLRYTYNGLNQLTRITKDGKQQAEYRYDGRGNQVYENRIYGEAVINGVTTPVYQTREYEFDLRNLLERAEVSTPSAVVGNVVEYEEVVTENRYDGSGQRIRREENGRETRFYYMGSGLLYTTAGDRTLVTENILGLNGGIIGSKRFSDPYGTPEEEYANRYYFYHYDIRGSVTNIVGDDGKLVKGYEYDEYGNTTDGGEESFINEVTFTGSVRDLGSGLQYMNARYYDPATGRFVSQDTYTGTPYAPWTQHLYSYCGNNPVNMVDPTGHMPIKPIAVCDGGTTNVVPEPSGSEENVSWWNKAADWVSNAASDAWEWVKNAAIDVNDFLFLGWEYQYNDILFDPVQSYFAGSPIRYDFSSYTQVDVQRVGNGNRPLVLYLNNINGSFLDSHIGLKANIGEFYADIRLGLDDIGVHLGDSKNSFGVSLSLKELGKLKIGASQVMPTNEYTDVVMNHEIVLDVLMLALIYLTSGSTAPVPAY